MAYWKRPIWRNSIRNTSIFGFDLQFFHGLIIGYGDDFDFILIEFNSQRTELLTSVSPLICSMLYCSCSQRTVDNVHILASQQRHGRAVQINCHSTTGRQHRRRIVGELRRHNIPLQVFGVVQCRTQPRRLRPRKGLQTRSGQVPGRTECVLGVYGHRSFRQVSVSGNILQRKPVRCFLLRATVPHVCFLIKCRYVRILVHLRTIRTEIIL